MSCGAPCVAFFLGWIFVVTEANLYEGHSLGSSCLPGYPCTLAFISDNPVILRCPYTHPRAQVSWQYLDPRWTNEQPITFLRSESSSWPSLSHAKLMRFWFRSRLIAGHLYIPSPSIKDSGVYTCQVGDATIAYYNVDFQDAGHLHVSHASLGGTVSDNVTVELENGTRAELFTSWSPWQACDRCSRLGERKRVGFCYAQVTKSDQEVEKPLPCGIARRKYPMLPQRGPELRMETCQVPCDTPEKPNTASLLVFTTLHPQPMSVAHLRCPSSSIYSPVYWQEGLTKLTHFELLQKNSSQSLDKATGGGILHLTFQNGSQSTVYWCYVNGHLVGRFFVTSPAAVPAPKELARSYSSIEALVVGLSIFLVFMMFLSIIQSCRRKPETTIV
ncbi:protein FAM187B [Pogona vitticeps]